MKTEFWCRLRKKKFALLDGTLVSKSRKLQGIHGLRAIAALVVLFTHAGSIIQMMGYSPSDLTLVATLNNIGVTGVHLFFVLSSFSLANSITLTSNGVYEYGIKRFFRIAPLFYLLLVFQLLWKGPIGAEHHQLNEILLNFSFLFNFTPNLSTGIVYGGWTIGVEMIFYALLPFILLMCRNIYSYYILAPLGLLISWASHIAISESNPTAHLNPFTNYATFSFITNIAPFFIGLLAFGLYKKFPSNCWVARTSILSALGLIFILFYTSLQGEFDTPGRPAHLILYTAYGLICLSQSIRPSWVTANVAMQYLGERSFSIYLVQLPLIWIITPLYSPIINYFGGYTLQTYLTCAVLTFILVIAVSELTYRLVEIPGVNIGRAIIAKRRSKWAAC